MSDERLDAAVDGRDPRGRFGPGNSIGRGNPHARRVARLRSELMRAVTPADLREVIAALLDKAKAGDVLAARLILDRTLGPCEAMDLLARVETLEQSMRCNRE